MGGEGDAVATIFSATAGAATGGAGGCGVVTPVGALGDGVVSAIATGWDGAGKGVALGTAAGCFAGTGGEGGAGGMGVTLGVGGSTKPLTISTGTMTSIARRSNPF